MSEREITGGTGATSEPGEDNLTHEQLLAALRERPCPHVRTGDDGTSYCELAESSARAAEAVTRVELIDHRVASAHRGRAFVAYDVRAEVQYQDEGRTLKVFVDDRPAAQPSNAEERQP